MLLLMLSLCVGLCVSNVVVPSYHGDEDWVEYKQRFSKIYSSESEEQMRYQVWKNEINEIAVHNAVYGHQYQQGVNHLSDMTDEEYQKYSTGLLPEYENESSLAAQPHVPLKNLQLPDSVDWAKKGYVTRVKGQGRCGSCYAFAATGSLEGQWKKRTGRLVSLSEQQIVDCSGRGCHGGMYTGSWKYFIKSGGADSEKAYPYKAKQGKCNFKPDDVVATVKGYRRVKRNDENALKEAVANVGPIAVAINARGKGFGRYKSGVYYDPNCTQKLNHAVLAVGYGSENGQDYWLVKNSWGHHWGMSGYIKMARNKNNNCGIAKIPAYPLV